jgi:hypothetical protein
MIKKTKKKRQNMWIIGRGKEKGPRARAEGKNKKFLVGFALSNIRVTKKRQNKRTKRNTLTTFMCVEKYKREKGHVVTHTTRK